MPVGAAGPGWLRCPNSERIVRPNCRPACCSCWISCNAASWLGARTVWARVTVSGVIIAPPPVSRLTVLFNWELPPLNGIARRMAMPPPAAEIARHLIDAFVAGDYRLAAQIQLQFALFPAKWMHRGLTATMKTAMRLIGLSVGELYPPYVSLDAGETQALADYLKTTVLEKRLK